MVNLQNLIKFLETNKTASFLTLAKTFNIRPFQNKEFSKYLVDLKNKGIICFSRKIDKFYLPILIGKFNTKISIRNKDYGFVFFFDETSIEKRAIIFSENLHGALDGDEVDVSIFQEIEEDKYYGVINEIKKRKTSYVFAMVDENFDIDVINLKQEYSYIYDKNQLKKNTYVKFKIIHIENNIVKLEYIETLSNISDPYSDIDLMVDIFQVDKYFTDEVVNETKFIPEVVENKTLNNRKDLTNELIVTIDGEKTKDFDDAISVKKTNNNTFILSVHIADVAYYVKEDSAIDKQALKRATSIYLIDKVIPMLPEKLSNGICSLNPNVDRYTITLESEIDQNGNVLWTNLFPSTINSKYRLTYNQVENFKNDEIFKNDLELFTMIDNAFELSKILSSVKINQGYIDFEIEEPTIDLDKNGKAIAINIKKRLSSEVLIENFMVFANEQVSKMISKLNIPSIYRIHEAPNEDKFNSLINVLQTLNIKANIIKSEDPKLFAIAINEIKEQRFDNFIKIIMLRTMQKAKYSSINIGHFGLASEYYSHFTSPIRRYPDLFLHRIIWEVIFNKNESYIEKIKSKVDLVASISSKKEEDALSIERKVIDVKKSEYYETNIGKQCEGTIVSIQKFGIFVEFDDKVDALVHVSNLSKNQCIVNENATKITCEEEIYKIGQKVIVEIISTSKIEGKIDAKIVKI